MRDRLTYMTENYFHNASGFPLELSSVAKNEVKELQNALNTYWNASLTVDGKFGTKTKTAVELAGYMVPVNEISYNAIIAGKKPNVTNLSQNQLHDLWVKLGKPEGDFQKWMKKEQNKMKLKELAGGVFSAANDWFKAKASEAGMSQQELQQEMYDSARKEDEIWGMPKGVVYAGGAVIGLGLIIGVIALATRKPKQVMMQVPA